VRHFDALPHSKGVFCFDKVCVYLGQLEHVEPHGVDARQRDELVLEAHGAELALELGDGGVVQVLLPVEGRGAVVRQHLAGELGVHSVTEFLQWAWARVWAWVWV